MYTLIYCNFKASTDVTSQIEWILKHWNRKDLNLIRPIPIENPEESEKPQEKKKDMKKGKKDAKKSAEETEMEEERNRLELEAEMAKEEVCI